MPGCHLVRLPRHGSYVCGHILCNWYFTKSHCRFIFIVKSVTEHWPITWPSITPLAGKCLTSPLFCVSQAAISKRQTLFNLVYSCVFWRLWNSLLFPFKDDGFFPHSHAGLLTMTNLSIFLLVKNMQKNPTINRIFKINTNISIKHVNISKKQIGTLISAVIVFFLNYTCAYKPSK